MEVQAVAKSIRISPRKVRLVVDAVRNLPIDQALKLLLITDKKAGYVIAKTLKSAVANATNNANLDKGNLVIASMMVNEGTPLKRFHPSTRGRVHPYKKRSSNLHIVLKEKVVAEPALKAIEAKNEKSVAKDKADKGGKK